MSIEDHIVEVQGHLAAALASRNYAEYGCATKRENLLNELKDELDSIKARLDALEGA